MSSLLKKTKIKAKTLKKAGLASLGLLAVAAVPVEAGAASNMVNKLLGYVFGIFFWVGILLLAWGVGQLVLAFKNEDADSKSRAMLVIVAAIILTSVGTIVSGVVNNSGLSVTISGKAKTSF